LNQRKIISKFKFLELKLLSQMLLDVF